MKRLACWIERSASPAKTVTFRHSHGCMPMRTVLLAAIEQTGQRWFDSEVYRVRGELLLKLRQPDVAAAESAFMRAIEIARSQQTRRAAH
jgi:predicted RNA polymerase sigma factor